MEMPHQFQSTCLVVFGTTTRVFNDSLEIVGVTQRMDGAPLTVLGVRMILGKNLMIRCLRSNAVASFITTSAESESLFLFPAEKKNVVVKAREHFHPSRQSTKQWFRVVYVNKIRATEKLPYRDMVELLAPSRKNSTYMMCR